MAHIEANKEIFEQQVLNSEKKVLVDFWAPWCGPCRMVVPIVEEIARENPDIKVGKVNVDEEHELASQFKVISIPSLFVLKNGKVINQRRGSQKAEGGKTEVPGGFPCGSKRQRSETIQVIYYNRYKT